MAKIQFIFKKDNNKRIFLLKSEIFFIFHTNRSTNVILPFCQNIKFPNLFAHAKRKEAVRMPAFYLKEIHTTSYKLNFI